MMKWPTTALAALFFAVLSPIAQAAWVDATGKPLPDTASMRSSGDLGVRILLTKDAKAFRKNWSASRTPPSTQVADTVRLGQSVTAFVVFHGCKANARGVCDLVCDFVVTNPDGKQSPGKGGAVWNRKPPQPRYMQLGQTSLTAGFQPTDPVGAWKVIANVKDKVSGATLSVETDLAVTE
jgi:hypothetical protein